MEMELSELLNVILGGGLVGAVISIVTVRSALKKARADAERALAESDTVKITNTEQATRILVDNIVEPLKQELYETRKEIGSVKREVARLRKAIDGANTCRYNADCPVLDRMRESAKGNEAGKAIREDRLRRSYGQRASPRGGQRVRAGGEVEEASVGTDVVSEADDSDGQPP